MYEPRVAPLVAKAGGGRFIFCRQLDSFKGRSLELVVSEEQHSEPVQKSEVCRCLQERKCG